MYDMVTGVRVAERLNSEPLAVTLRAAAGRCVHPSFVVYMFLLCLESQVHSCLMFTCTHGRGPRSAPDQCPPKSTCSVNVFLARVE